MIFTTSCKLAGVGEEEFPPFMILVVILQILLIRLVFIEFAFRWLSKESMNRLRGVLDVEWS